MSGLRSRVRRVERALSGGGCACGGPRRLRMVIEGRDPEPGPCPKCGTVGTVLRIVRGEPPDGWAQRWETEDNPPGPA